MELPPGVPEVCLRNNSAFKSQLCRFGEAHLQASHRTDFSSEADFADPYGCGIERLVSVRAGDGQRHTQIDGGFLDFHTADYIDENILALQMQAQALFQDCDEEERAVGV